MELAAVPTASNVVALHSEIVVACPDSVETPTHTARAAASHPLETAQRVTTTYLWTARVEAQKATYVAEVASAIVALQVDGVEVLQVIVPLVVRPSLELAPVALIFRWMELVEAQKVTSVRAVGSGTAAVLLDIAVVRLAIALVAAKLNSVNVLAARIFHPMAPVEARKGTSVLAVGLGTVAVLLATVVVHRAIALVDVKARLAHVLVERTRMRLPTGHAVDRRSIRVLEHLSARVVPLVATAAVQSTIAPKDGT